MHLLQHKERVDTKCTQGESRVRFYASSLLVATTQLVLVPVLYVPVSAHGKHNECTQVWSIRRLFKKVPLCSSPCKWAFYSALKRAPFSFTSWMCTEALTRSLFVFTLQLGEPGTAFVQHQPSFCMCWLNVGHRSKMDPLLINWRDRNKSRETCWAVFSHRGLSTFHVALCKQDSASKEDANTTTACVTRRTLWTHTFTGRDKTAAGVRFLQN